MRIKLFFKVYRILKQLRERSLSLGNLVIFNKVSVKEKDKQPTSLNEVSHLCILIYMKGPISIDSRI